MDIHSIREKKIWEDFISQQTYTSPFQSWNWAQFERKLGNIFETFGLFDGNVLKGLLPVKYVCARRGRYLHLRHGPIFDFCDEYLWTVFFEFITQKAKEKGLSFIRMSPLVEQSQEDKYIHTFASLRESPMHDVDAEITWVLDLTQSQETILSQMRKTTRYSIRRAQRDGVKILRTTDEQYLRDFWLIYQDTVRRQKWQAYSQGYIEKEFAAFRQDNAIDLYLAEYKGKYIAGAFILYYQDQAIYHHSGALTMYRKIPASFLIQWEAIQEAKKRGLDWYNFWGVSPLVRKGREYRPQAGHPWEGLTFFKLGFGGELRQFIHAKDLPVNKLKYTMTRVYEKFEKWRRGY